MKNLDMMFKGTKEGVIIKVEDECDYSKIKKAIESKLSISNDFFRSSNIFIDFSKSSVDDEHRQKIIKDVYESYGISIKCIDSNKIKMFTGINEGKTKFLRNTIRSGQNFEYSGNVVIIGDINAGGQASAGGNIIVLGALRGVVHAGISGNEKAIIAAFSLQPTQLRIAGLISRAPDGDKTKPKCPEMARINGKNIIIEPYAPNKFL